MSPPSHFTNTPSIFFSDYLHVFNGCVLDILRQSEKFYWTLLQVHPAPIVISLCLPIAGSLLAQRGLRSLWEPQGRVLGEPEREWHVRASVQDHVQTRVWLLTASLVALADCSGEQNKYSRTALLKCEKKLKNNSLILLQERERERVRLLWSTHALLQNMEKWS